MSRHALIDAVDALLPQTQCGKCGFDGCLPYAEAIADGEPVNRCPPGGEDTLAQLVKLTGQPAQTLAEPAQPPLAAVIREDECIGCTKCIQACPVDAILGAAKRMHTVITDECTGCELCVAPCPVDCIDMVAHPAWQASRSAEEQDDYIARRAELGRQRHRARQQRLTREAREKRLERRKRRRQKKPLGKPHRLNAGRQLCQRYRAAPEKARGAGGRASAQARSPAAFQRAATRRCRRRGHRHRPDPQRRAAGGRRPAGS